MTSLDTWYGIKCIHQAYGVLTPGSKSSSGASRERKSENCRGWASFHPHPTLTLKARGIMDIDGNANAWTGCQWKMNSNSVVLKVASRCHQWYYHKLKPWEHYIPVTATLSDLKEKVNYVIDHANDAKLLTIQQKSTEVMQSLTLSSELERSRAVFSNFYAKYDVTFPE